MSEGELVPIWPSILDLDWLGDLTLYQHPPCMFILWYATLGVQTIWEFIDELLNSEGGGEGGDESGGGGGGEDEGKGDKEEGDEGGDEEGGEEDEAPPEEEEAPPEEAG